MIQGSLGERLRSRFQPCTGKQHIQAFRPALNDQSASRKDTIEAQYLLARTFESAGQHKEAAELYRSITRTNPRFRDAAYRYGQLTSPLRSFRNGSRHASGNGSWFGHAFANPNRLIGIHK